MNTKIPDFSLITFLPVGERSEEDPSEPTNLLKVFKSIVNSQPLCIDQRQLERMFISDLLIDTKKLNQPLVSVLAEAFVYYLTVWPGWQKSNEYISGELQCDQWYTRLLQFLMLKCNFIIKTAPSYTALMKSVKHQEVMTDIGVPVSEEDKKTAPFVLYMGGSLSTLNNLNFAESNGHVLVKNSDIRPWPSLSLKEMLNLPYIGVEVKLNDLHFTRTNVHQIQRYMALSGDSPIITESSYISEIKKLNNATDAELIPYSYDLLQHYVGQLTTVLGTVASIKTRVKELQAILDEFLADIKAANVYSGTVCTMTSVTYQIGKCRYIRNKTMAKRTAEEGTSNKSDAIFYELITPYMEYGLHHLKIDQDMATKETVTFQSLNRLNKLITRTPNDIEVSDMKTLIKNTCISYFCTFCDELFQGAKAYSDLTKHCEDKHADELSVVCYECRKEFLIKDLAKNRWKHACEINKEK